MDKIKTLQTKLSKLQKEADKLGKVYTKAGGRWSRAQDKVNSINKMILEAKAKEIASQPVVAGEWYDYNLNGDVFLKVNRQLIDGSFELFMVNIHNKMPNLSLLEMSRKHFFEKCKKIDRPPVDKIMDKIKEFING